MKMLPAFLRTPAAGLFLGILVLGSYAVPAQNIIENGGFEIENFYLFGVPDNYPDGWDGFRFDHTFRTAGTLGTWQTGIARSGTHSLLIDNLAASPPPELFATDLVQGSSFPPLIDNPVFGASPGQTFNFSGWIKNNSAMPMTGSLASQLNIVFLQPDPSGNLGLVRTYFNSPLINAASLSSGDWTLFSTGDVVAPANTSGIAFSISQITGGTGTETGSFFADDFTATLVTVPEPASMLLFSAGFALLLLTRFWRR